MLDWKKRRGTMRDRVDNSVDDVRTYFGGPWLVRVVGGLLGIYLLVAMLVGWYWSQEPDLFPVQQDAQAAAERAGRQMVTGYTTVETLKEVVDTLLTKPGGYISNDIFPPGIWMDNMPSWEYGVLVQVRDISRALRKDFARSQSQSTEDADLARAEPRFNFDNKSLGAAGVRVGVPGRHQVAGSLPGPSVRPEPAQRAVLCPRRQPEQLAGRRRHPPGLAVPAPVGERRPGQAEHQHQEPRRGTAGRGAQGRGSGPGNPWLQIDNVFYEARGQAWALSHLLRAIEVDFADVLAKKNATVSVRQIIRELEAAQEPLWSPMVLNGSGYGILANHSLVMANYISRANAAVIDLRQLLSQG